MQKLFVLSMLSLALVACDQHDKPKNLSQNVEDSDSLKRDSNNFRTNADNTERNVRDRNPGVKTPFDQSESEGDRKITQRIRQLIIEDDALSTNAKNIKIITIKGVVTLRGPVANQQEKEAIIRKINEIREIVRLENQLEITGNN